MFTNTEGMLITLTFGRDHFLGRRNTLHGTISFDYVYIYSIDVFARLTSTKIGLHFGIHLEQERQALNMTEILLTRELNFNWNKLWNIVKFLNIRTPKKLAVISLKFEHSGFTIEQCIQKM